jgi:hypothetical protein
MTVEYVVFVVWVFSFVGIVILVWKKLRVIDAGLGKMRKEIDHLQIVDLREFRTKLNANAGTKGSETETDNDPAQYSGGDVVPLRKESPPTAPH